MSGAAQTLKLLVGLSLALVTGAASAAPPAKEAGSKVEGELLVWSGGKTRAEAEFQQETLKPYLEALKPFLPVKPAVMESARVEGLKPGFFIVALGVCPKEKLREPLSVFQALYPDVYTRTVAYKPTEETPKLACPELASDATDDNGEPVPWKLEKTARVSQKGNTLVGLAFTYRWDEAGDFARSFHVVQTLYLLVDAKKRRLLDSKVHDSPSDAATLESLTTEEGRLDSSIKYGDPRCDPGSDYFKGWRTWVKASISKGAIRIDPGEPDLLEEGSCGYADEARMITGEGRDEEPPSEPDTEEP
jgi:hypothetical protein